MAEASDIILPMLREMRAELASPFEAVDQGAEAIEAARKSSRQAWSADSLLSKLVAGEFQQQIEALEDRVERLEAGK